MRLTKLELHGFKSFADVTEMQFEPGVTAIVGPNGCGKSNVSDAVRWVLGEQRPRALRGAKMEEVIFQGSSARKPVSLAEVSLHFENDDGQLGVPFREVVVTRRLSRSGESEYFLNRSACRLRDIHDMLRGTGLGTDAGVVIESRMIDALLSDRPDERRELFEEAAGVGLYRDRKRAAERRLEETTVNLSRLDDLISEVQTQVRSLARQRRRAERHAELTAKRFHVEVALAAREMAAWGEELVTLESRVAELRNSVPAAEAAVLDAESARDMAHGTRAATEASRAELARLVADQREITLQLRAEIAVAEERQKNAIARRERAEMERREGGSAVERVGGDLAGAQSYRNALEQELQAARSALEEEAADEEGAREEVANARALVEEAERMLRELRDKAHRHALDRAAAERELQEITARSGQVQDDIEQLSAAEQVASRELAQIEQNLVVAREKLDALNVELEDAREALRAAREDDSLARSSVLRAEEAITALDARANALEALERDRVGLAPAAARLLRERAKFGEGAILGPLSDYIRADSEAAAQVERFLGPSVHAILVRDRNSAEQIGMWHSASNPGALMLLPVDPGPRASDSAGESSGLRIEADEPARAWVSALLAGVSPLHEGSAFVDARGAVWLPARVAGPGPLRRRAEIREIRREIDGAQQSRADAEVRAAQSRQALTEAESAAARVQELATSAARALLEQEDRLAVATRRHQRAMRDSADARTLLERLETQRTSLGEAIAAIERVASQHGHAVAEQEQVLEGLRNTERDAERVQEEVRRRRTERQVEAAQALARLEVASDRERHFREELASATARLQALEGELTDLSASDVDLARQLATWHLELEASSATLGDAETRLADAERNVAESDTALTEAEHRLSAARHSADTLTSELHSSELRLTELSGRRAAITSRLETEWRRPLQEMLGAADPVELDDDALRSEAAQLREQVESLGLVNPLAIEEHEEEQRRLETLTRQREDLTAAKGSLQQAIREMDTTARDLFLQTFAQVRENFRQIFMTLFGGGECDLRLENRESPLDGDIEIHAAPKGKRTQRIHLLSSGERALVALSLLFGLFLTKPSPFCLLDEVDAPLDDANIGRFVRMLNQFKKGTQFIVITHNPRTTMEAANSVYGVTMQEPGVSSIVSVHLRGSAVEEAIYGAQPAQERRALSA